MRLLSLRLIVSLIVGITLVSFGFSYYEVLREKHSLRADLERRDEVLGESLVSNVEQLWSTESYKELEQLVQRFGNREHLLGVVIYDRKGSLVAVTPELDTILSGNPPQVIQAIREGHQESAFVRLGSVQAHILALPIHRPRSEPATSAKERPNKERPNAEAGPSPSSTEPDDIVGGLAVVHDASYIRAQILLVWRQTFFRVLAQVFLIALITLLIVRWSIAGPIARAALWMKALRTGKISFRQEVPDLEMFRPLAREVATMAASLNHARNAAENEARLREAGESMWTADRLSVQLRTRLDGGHLVVVSNREPYMHERNGKILEVVVPPSGLVTGLEPVLTACDGTWIAHGSGSADSEVVDSHDRLRVPPEEPRYTLRRVWLTKEEEEGYYYGFANEGLWPLCHIAHTRPLFRAADWQWYQDVNQKFMATVLQEIEHVDKPVVLVQDYHFALLPRLIKERRPDARVAIFWHIPWPNPEAFGICPWQRQLVNGLLGADLIGFHIQAHCNNFLETVDRVVESRIDWEHFSVRRQKHRTLVRPFPISVVLTDEDGHAGNEGTEVIDRSSLLRTHGVEASYMGIGVDRVDYTKGILERFLAIERFLEKYPAYQGKFTFVQIGAPSRTHIKRYHDLFAEVQAEADRSGNPS
jgi:trehalose-6-phosphate synthase